MDHINNISMQKKTETKFQSGVIFGDTIRYDMIRYTSYVRPKADVGL